MPDAQPDPALELLNQHLADARARLATGRADVEPVPEYDDAFAYREATLSLLRSRRNHNAALIKCLWEIQRQGLFLYMGLDGAEYNTITEWAESELIGSDPELSDDEHAEEAKYIRRQVLVVERMLPTVHARHISGTPFVDRNGSAITPERLVSGTGMVSKVIIASELFGKDSTATPQEQQEMLQAVVHDNRDKVTSTKQSLTGRELGPKLAYVLEPCISSTGVKYRAIFPELTEGAVAALRALLGNAGTEVMSISAVGD